jgi:membrane-associated PAP2 superfamily phosphatase
MVFAWFPLPRKLSVLATILAVGLAILVGWSRIVPGAHSWGEVVAGWCLGAMVSGTALLLMCGMKSNRPDLSAVHWFVGLALLAMFSMSQSAAVSMPVHPLEVRLALKLSGHDRPFSRIDLQRRAGI